MLYYVMLSHLDCNFSKILINSNALNILVTCKRRFPKEKTHIINMLCYLIYVKNMKIHFITSYVPNSKSKPHCMRKFCCTYKLQYTHCFFRAETSKVNTCFMLVH